MSQKLKSITQLLHSHVNLAKVNGKRKCDLKDTGSLYKAHSSCTIENWPCAACEYMPCCNHLKHDGFEESHYHVVFEHWLIIALNGNFID